MIHAPYQAEDSEKNRRTGDVQRFDQNKGAELTSGNDEKLNQNADFRNTDHISAYLNHPIWDRKQM